MISAAQILFEVAGKPAQDGCADLANESLCWLCGEPRSRAMPLNKWMGANFTDQNKCKAPGSGLVCEACVWSCSWTAPPGFEVAPDAKRGPNLRQYSHLWGEYEGYVYASKAEKPKILAFLRRQRRPGRWFAAIAGSGKKHTLPWTPVNAGGPTAGRAVYFEESTIYLPDNSGWGIVDEMVALLTAGPTKAEIQSGNYRPRSWELCRDRIARFEYEWGNLHRGSKWWGLALWLAQRDEEGYRAATKRGKT